MVIRSSVTYVTKATNLTARVEDKNEIMYTQKAIKKNI